MGSSGPSGSTSRRRRPRGDVSDLESLSGHLLVAEPALRDPNFSRTVVYLIEHSAGGALGLVLNRPGQVTVRDAIPSWGTYIAGDERVFVGGPVNPEGAICLARAADGSTFPPVDDDEPAPLRPITPTIAVVDLHRDPSDVPSGVSELRIFGGYAGWSGGQLEGELAAGGWYVLSAADDDVFCPEPAVLWHDVLRRQPGELRSRAFFPEDPSVN